MPNNQPCNCEGHMFDRDRFLRLFVHPQYIGEESSVSLHFSLDM